MTSTQVEVQTEPAVKPIIAAKTETDREWRFQCREIATLRNLTKHSIFC